MRRISIDNPRLETTYITDIAVDYSSGTALTTRNNNSFAVNDLVVAGNPGEELTEQKKLDGISGNTILTLSSAFKFQHNKGTPIYKSLWDNVSIEGRSSSAGVFAEITQSPLQWDSKDRKTIYFHSAGTDTWEYRFRFYNSVTTLYSEYSPTLSGGGFTQFQMGYIIRDARRIAGDKEGRIMQIDELLRELTRAKNIIRAHNPKYWFWRVDAFHANQSIAATAGNNIYDLSSLTNFGTLDLLEYRFTNGGTDNKWLLKKKTDIEFLEYTRDLNRPNNDYPHFFRLLPADANSTIGYFEIENKMQNSGLGTFYPSYYKNEPNYNSVDDTTAIIMPEILVDYLVAKIYETKGNSAMANKYYKLFSGPENRQKTLALQELTGIALLDELDKQQKKSQGQPQSLWRFRGQKAISRLFGNRAIQNPDYIRENYFDGRE